MSNRWKDPRIGKGVSYGVKIINVSAAVITLAVISLPLGIFAGCAALTFLSIQYVNDWE